MRTRFLLLLGIAGLAACGDSSPKEPDKVPGDLILAVGTAQTETGALLIRIAGGPVAEVKAIGTYRVSSNIQPSVTRVVVTGAIVPGDIIRLAVPDVGIVTQYTAYVEQAALSTTHALISGSEYLLILRK
jgi:hypothetical protein